MNVSCQQGCFIIWAPGNPAWTPAPTRLHHVEFYGLLISTGNTNDRLGEDIDPEFCMGIFSAEDYDTSIRRGLCSFSLLQLLGDGI